MIGFLIPDLVKINLTFTWPWSNSFQFFEPPHTPIGAFLAPGIIAIFFKDARKAFVPLGIDVLTHFILDLFLSHMHGGMKLFFLFSWKEWQYYLIQYDDYMVTIGMVLASLLVYSIYRFHAKRKSSSPQ